MRRKISQSIQAKTFLSMLALLVVCCIIIYGMVMIFLPRNYHTELEGQVTSDFYDLVEVLERTGWEASSDSLLEFSMTNNASVEVNDDYGNNLFSVNFADMENMDTSAPVSYTHLDVYKRQLPFRFAQWIWNGEGQPHNNQR